MSGDVYTAEGLRTTAFENTAAVMKSNHIWVTGCWSIVQSMETAAQARREQSWSTWKSITGPKSLFQAFEAQSELACTSFQRSLTESARLAKASIELMQETMQPMAACMVRPANSPPTLFA